MQGCGEDGNGVGPPALAWAWGPACHSCLSLLHDCMSRGLSGKGTRPQ